MIYLVFFVGLSKSGLEASVRVHESGDLFNGVHDEHVHEVLPGAVQPDNRRQWYQNIAVKWNLKKPEMSNYEWKEGPYRAAIRAHSRLHPFIVLVWLILTIQVTNYVRLCTYLRCQDCTYQLLKGAARLANSRCSRSICSSTRSASSRAWRLRCVSAPRRSHCEQMRWHRAFTLATSWYSKVLE